MPEPVNPPPQPGPPPIGPGAPGPNPPPQPAVLPDKPTPIHWLHVYSDSNDTVGRDIPVWTEDGLDSFGQACWDGGRIFQSAEDKSEIIGAAKHGIDQGKEEMELEEGK